MRVANTGGYVKKTTQVKVYTNSSKALSHKQLSESKGRQRYLGYANEGHLAAATTLLRLHCLSRGDGCRFSSPCLRARTHAVKKALKDVHICE